MRRSLLILIASACLPAWSQQTRPKDLEPVPDPPPPAGAADDEGTEPQVTIIQRSDQTVEEYRIKGRVYMMKVTPSVGPPYYLLDNAGDGNFTRFDNLDNGLRPPRWVIKEF